LSYCRALIVFFGAAMVLVPSVLCAERERERERESGSWYNDADMVGQDSGVVDRNEPVAHI
jgi:hypothetical protein